MARRKLSPGVHNVIVGGKRRRVRVLKNGQWRFLKGKATTKRRTSKSRGTGKRSSASIPRGAKSVTQAQARGKARYIKHGGRYLRVRK